MKSVNQTLRNGRFDVDDNGFSARVMASVQIVPRPMVVMPRPISIWTEFRLPVIGVAIGILLIGFIVTRPSGHDSWNEIYIEKTTQLSTRLTSLPLLSPTPPPTEDETTPKTK